MTTTAQPATEGPLVRSASNAGGSAGFVDFFGERHLKFDHSAGASLETLRIRKELADLPEFEAALRARVDELRQVQHPSLATIHGIERREADGLCLVSKLTSGRRVSELVPKAHGAAFALELLRLVTPAIAMLHRTGEGIAHGALSAERIVVARDGRLVVVDQVFGSAIEALKPSRQELIDMGLIAPAEGAAIRLTGRTDMAQLGFIALSLLLGRQLDPADYPANIPALLDEFVRTTGSPVLSAKLRTWLERALQISPRGFGSAREAQDALGDLPDDMDVRMADAIGTQNAQSSQNTPVRTPIPAALKPIPAASAVTPIAQAAPPRREPTPMFTPAFTPESESATAPAPITFEKYDAEDSVRSPRQKSSWMMPALAVLAGVEGVVIGALLYTRPPADAGSAIQPAARTAQAVIPPAAPPTTAPSPTPAVSPAPTSAAVTTPKTETAPATTPLAAAGTAATGAAAAAVPPASRFGGVNVSSPIELQVFKDGRHVGSTASPIAINEGAHNLEFVNEDLGFRMRQTVNVKSGQMSAVNVGVPNGRISINAVPWAEVFIDGTAAGETPIANLSLPIGTHEIVFRHPQLGEKKQTVVVKVDGLTRVTQTLQSGFRY